jgi:hypothetical protein
MSNIGGKNGHVVADASPVGCIRTWGVSSSADIKSMVCSASGGGTIRVPGNVDWTGSYTGYGPIPAVLPGASFAFAGAITGTGAAAVGASGNAIVESVTINWDMENAQTINHIVNFGGNGALTLGTVTVAADDTTPTPYPSKGMNVLLTPYVWGSAAGAESPIAKPRNVALTLTTANSTYADGGTSGLVQRVPGNLDATMTITCHADSVDGWASFPQVNECYRVRIQTDDTPKYWDISWMIFNALTGMDVDVETATLVGCSMNAGWTAFWNVSGASTQGGITDPESSAVYP